MGSIVAAGELVVRLLVEVFLWSPGMRRFKHRCYREDTQVHNKILQTGHHPSEERTEFANWYCWLGFRAPGL